MHNVATNLPYQLTSFIGRERDLGEMKRLLAQHRLITLTGPGGCGKTRLAVQVATDVPGLFADGVWFVELAMVSDAARVSYALARALDLHEQAGEAMAE